MESSLGSLGGRAMLKCEPKVEKKEFMGMAKEAELELGLGLSLGGGAAEKEKEKGRRCEYGRILTAKDFPNGFASGRSGGGGGGTKRERVVVDVDEGSASAAAAVSQVVGWPPIRSYRMNTLFNHAKTSNLEDEEKGVGGDDNNESSKKKVNHGSDKNNENVIKETRGHLGFVKVNMDGFPIGRKVDLKSHKNYQTLANTLEEMFIITSSQSTCGGKEQGVPPLKLLDGSSEFVLTYEDKEGDWMLVGDVPWGMFINTVKRLRIMRTSEANGLAPKSQERNEKQKSKIK